MSLLTIVQDACREIPLNVPTVVVASSDATVLKLLRLANEDGKALAGRHPWQALTSEQTFTTVVTDAQTNSIPSDFDRIIPETMYNRTRRREVAGPVDQGTWQRFKATLVVPVFAQFRIRGNTILMLPTQTAGDTIAYEYITNKWCQSSSSVAQTAWAADTDTSKLNEEAHTLGLIWRFKQSVGVDFLSDYEKAEHYISDLIIRDGSRQRLRSDVTSLERVPIPPQVPDTLTFT